MELSNKGFYFSLDAMLGAALIIGGLLLATQMVAQEDSTKTINYASQDLLTSMTELRVNEMDHPDVKQMIQDGRIDNENNTLLEQLGEFWALNETKNAKNFTNAIAEELIPPRFGAQLGIEGEEFFSSNNTILKNNLVSSTRMVTGVKKGKAIRGSTASAHLERVSKKRTSSFLYFGGFTGQGNITGYIRDVPDDVNASDGDIRELKLEADMPTSFDVEINDDSCGSFTPNTGNMTAESWDLSACEDSIKPEKNKFEIIFTSPLSDAYVGGGFFKIKYETSDPQKDVINGTETYHFPGIDGVINLYDGFTVPGDIQEMEAKLHYWVDDDVSLPIFLDIGNKTVYEANATGEITYTLTDSTLRSVLNYSQLSGETIPFRLGFYEGNTTAEEGNISDVFLLTSRAGTMDEADINGTTKTRMEVAKNLSHQFVNIVLNATGNRVGLASYFASSQIDHQLSDDNQSLHNTISNYDVQNPSQAQRYLCQNIEDAKSELQAVGSGRAKSMVMMTDGNATKCCSSGQCTVEKARQDAIDAACDDYDVTGINIHTIGFGQGADDEMLEEIANCTDGLFRESNNFTGLEDIYEEFAATVASSSIAFQFQRATQASNVDSELYADSWIKTDYDPQVEGTGANEISITLQTGQFGSCNPSFDIYPELRVLSASVTSYSGSHWTSLVEANGNTAYDLSTYAFNYTALGDPFRINVPPSYLQGGSNSMQIQTGDNTSSTTGCSDNNSMVYTAAVNLSSGRSSVVSKAEGCEWTVDFESGNTTTFKVPKDYNGTETCSYTSSDISYDTSDAYDLAVYQILSKVDFDDDGEVFVDFTEQDLEIEVTVVRKVPYLWGPAIAEVQLWE